MEKNVLAELEHYMNATNATLSREKRRQYVWTPQLDALLEQGYRTGRAGRRFAFSRIQKLTGWPRQACWDRARKLGLTARRSSPLRRWSTEEDQYLRNIAGVRNICVIAQKVNRSVAAIRTRLRRINLSSARVREGLTKSDLSELLGRSKKTIQVWIDRGWLKGCREGTLLVDDTIRVFERDLLEFWQNHPEEILFHRWSREGLEWFLSLLSELAVAGIWQSQLGWEPGTICSEGDQNIREISV